MQPLIPLKPVQHSGPDSRRDPRTLTGGSRDGSRCDDSNVGVAGGSGSGSERLSAGSAGSGSGWARPGLTRIVVQAVAIMNTRSKGPDFTATAIVASGAQGRKSRAEVEFIEEFLW